MEHFTSAYGRALFPRRFELPGGDGSGTGTAGRGQPMVLAPGGVEIAMGAGIYRAVCALEALFDRARRLVAGWRARAPHPAGNTPVSCG